MGRQGSTAQEQRGLHFYNKEEEGGEKTTLLLILLPHSWVDVKTYIVSFSFEPTWSDWASYDAI